VADGMPRPACPGYTACRGAANPLPIPPTAYRHFGLCIGIEGLESEPGLAGLHRCALGWVPAEWWRRVAAAVTCVQYQPQPPIWPQPCRLITCRDSKEAWNVSVCDCHVDGKQRVTKDAARASMPRQCVSASWLDGRQCMPAWHGRWLSMTAAPLRQCMPWRCTYAPSLGTIATNGRTRQQALNNSALLSRCRSWHCRSTHTQANSKAQLALACCSVSMPLTALHCPCAAEGNACCSATASLSCSCADLCPAAVACRCLCAASVQPAYGRASCTNLRMPCMHNGCHACSGL